MKRIKFRIKLLPLREIAIKFIIRRGIKFNYYALPVELSEEILERSYNPIYRYNYDEFYYDSFLLRTEPRLSSIGYNPFLKEYVKLLSLERRMVRILSRHEDVLLDSVLFDYNRRGLIPNEIKKCAYI